MRSDLVATTVIPIPALKRLDTSALQQQNWSLSVFGSTPFSRLSAVRTLCGVPILVEADVQMWHTSVELLPCAGYIVRPFSSERVFSLEFRRCDPSFPALFPGSRIRQEGHGCLDHNDLSIGSPRAIRLVPERPVFTCSPGSHVPHRDDKQHAALCEPHHMTHWSHGRCDGAIPLLDSAFAQVPMPRVCYELLVN